MPFSISRLVRAITVVSVLLAGACSSELPPEELLARAESALMAGDYRGALIDARSLLQQDPGNPEGRRILGAVELWKQNPGAAVEQFERALRASASVDLLSLYAEALVRKGDLEAFRSLVSQNYFAVAEARPEYLATLARSQAMRGNMSEAKSTIARASAAAPENLSVRLAAAEIMSKDGRDIGAIVSALESIVADHPESDRAWGFLGKFNFVLRDFDSAILALDNAASLNPNRFNDRLLYASALIRSGRIDDAAKVVSVLADVAPNAANVNLLLAELQLRQDDVNEALISVNKVLSVAPRQPMALYLAGLINSQANNLETARRNLMDLLGMQPQNTAARLKLAAIQLAMKEPQAAEESARVILERDPMNITATRILATALALMGNEAGSIEAFGRATALDPTSGATSKTYANLLTNNGGLEAGIAQLRDERDQDPESADIRAKLAAALLASGDNAGALAEADAFVSAYPNNPMSHALAGRVALGVGDAEAAQRHFDKAVSLDAGNIAANFGLASLAMEAGNAKLAEQHYERALANNPGHLPTLLNMAVLSEGVGDLTAMASRLEVAVEQHPDVAEPRISLARYRLSQRRYSDAVDLLMPVSESHATEPAIHEILTRSFMALGDYSSALTQSTLLVQNAPGNPAALVLRSRAESELGRLADAERSLRAAGELTDSPVIEEQLIAVLLKAKKFDAAREELDRIPAGALTPWRYEFARGRIAESQGENTAAAAAFARALKLEPLNSTLVARTNALWRGGEQAVAVSELYEWLAVNPDDALVLGHLGNLHLLLQEDKAALTLFERLNTLQPGSPAVLNNLAWASRNTNPERSLAWAQRAMELAPGNSGIEDTYAMVLLANGNADEALAVNTRLQAKTPSEPELMLHGAEILVELGRTADAVVLLDKLIDEGKAVERAQALKATIKP